MAWPQAKAKPKPSHTGQAKPSQKSWPEWLWPGLDFVNPSNGPGHGFELNI